MKILHINSYYSEGNFYKNLYDNQLKDGLDISVYVPVPTFKNTEFSSSMYTTFSRTHNRFDRYIFHLKHYKIFRNIQKKYDINNFFITHAHSLFSNGYIALKLKKKYGIPYIVAVRNTDINIFFKYMYHLRKLGIKILKESDKIVFLSDSYKEFLYTYYIPKKYRNEFKEKSITIPNGIDDFWLENKGVPKIYERNSQLKFLYVGAINKNKNIIASVKSIYILQDKGYNATLTVVGKIEDQKIYNKMKDVPFVKYISSQKKEELIHIYRNNSIFIMPSITETFGLVYAEAMSQGLPIIYSKGQGFDKQFLDGKVGYGVNSSDPHEIVEKIFLILSNYKKISKSCISNVEKFSWRIISNKYKDLYISLYKNFK